MKRHVIIRQLLKLADAIANGSKERKKCTSKLFDLVGKDVLKAGSWVTRYRLGGSCALGAAYEGLFGTPPLRFDSEYENDAPKINGGEDQMYERLRKKLPVLAEQVDPDNAFSNDFEAEIIEKNDTHGWSRQHIAKWLRRVAAKL